MTLTVLSAEPEMTSVPEGLNLRLVTGKSCALRIVITGCKKSSVQNQHRSEHAKRRRVGFSSP